MADNGQSLVMVHFKDRFGIRCLGHKELDIVSRARAEAAKQGCECSPVCRDDGRGIFYIRINFVCGR